MSEVIVIFKKLHQFIDTTLTWEEVKGLYEEVQQQQQRQQQRQQKQYDENSYKKGENATPINRIINLLVVNTAIHNQQVASTLLDLCSTIRSLRSDSNGSYDNTYDCWDQLSKVIHINGFLAFIFALACLVHIDLKSSTYINISFMAIGTYFLCLTIPGAKIFHIFQEEIIAHCLQVFNLIERLYDYDFIKSISKQQNIRIWIQFSTLCDDIKLLLRYVHFSDYLDCRNEILRKLVDIQYLNYEKGYVNTYAINLHQIVFNIFEEIINAHNGDPEQTLLKIMNMTIILHTYAVKPKNHLINGRINSNLRPNKNDCEHITDWFIKIIDKYPRILVKILSFYIECVLTNPIKGWKSEQLQHALDYAAKYDAHLFTKCNESCVKLLCEAVYSDEIMIRSRAIDLMARILQIESQVDWQMFRHEISDIPREVYLIKELINSLQDVNNNIKLKSVQSIQSLLSKGSSTTIRILTESIKFVFSNESLSNCINLPEEPRLSKNEIRYERPTTKTARYSFKGYQILQLLFFNLPKHIFIHFYKNTSFYARRAGIMFMEDLIKLNSLFIFNTNFVTETVQLIDEPTVLVRRQSLLSLDRILEMYPNCYPIIWAWCKVITPMLQDIDPKNVELAMDCFRSRVLLNIRSIEESNKAEHFMPWAIIRTILRTQTRLYVQNCFHNNLHAKPLNSEIVSLIESHILTSNSTEAWILLNFLSGKTESREPDALIHHFISSESWNIEQNMLIALEVLRYHVQNFSHTALNQAFNHLYNQIKDGKIVPIIVGKAFDFLLLIDHQSRKTEEDNHKEQSTREYVELENKTWIRELHKHLEEKIVETMNEFPYNHTTFLSHMYSYTEVNVQTRLRPHQTIIHFMHRFLADYMKLNENAFDLDNERLFNSMVLLMGRLSLRDACVARTTCNLFSNVLKNMDRPPIVNTILVVLMDLCKKHAHIVENVTERVILKLKSPFEVNRWEAFKYFENLILEDHLKLRGALLLHLLSMLLDASQQLSQRVHNFFNEYIAKKNSALFHKCLLECPFTLNNYRNFESSESFSETIFLKGQIEEKYRCRLYEYFLKDIPKGTMLLYFEQLKVLAEKSYKEPSLKLNEGLAVVKDVLYILKRICELTKETSLNEEENSENNRSDEICIESNHSKTENLGVIEGQGNGNALGVQRGRKKREISMTEALSIVEKSLMFLPIIHKNLTMETGTIIQKCLDDLCTALATSFPNLIEYAQPLEFWKRFKGQHRDLSKSKKCTKVKSNRGPANTNTNDENDFSDFSFSDSDDYPLTAKKPRLSSHPGRICNK